MKGIFRKEITDSDGDYVKRIYVLGVCVYESIVPRQLAAKL
jgi:hypothetical protein